MYIEQLYYLVALSHCQSLSQAAEVCFVSQPALSKALGNLEKELGLTLFVRAHEGITLTEDGQRMAQYAGQAVAILDEMKSFANQQPAKAQLNFAAVTSICNTILSDVLTAFHFRQPDIQVAVKSLPTEEVLERIASGKADLGIISLPTLDSKRKKQILASEDFRFSLLFEDQLVLWISADHPLVLQDALTIDNLMSHNYAYIFAATGYESPKMILEDKYVHAIETSDRNLIMKLVLSSNMFSILPSLYCFNEPLLDKGMIQAIPYEKGSHLEYYLALRKAHIPQPTENDFLTIMLRALADCKTALEQFSSSSDDQ